LKAENADNFEVTHVGSNEELQIDSRFEWDQSNFDKQKIFHAVYNHSLGQSRDQVTRKTMHKISRF